MVRVHQCRIKMNKNDLVDHVFTKLFGTDWDNFFRSGESFFGNLLREVNIFAVYLIIIVTLFTIITGLVRGAVKESFLGKDKTVSFWVLRLVLFFGCCFPTLNGYSLAQGLFLNIVVKQPTLVANRITNEAFSSMFDKGLLPIGGVLPTVDSTLARTMYENAICHSYAYKTHEDKYAESSEPSYLNSAEIKPNKTVHINRRDYGTIRGGGLTPQEEEAYNAAVERVNSIKAYQYGVRWGGRGVKSKGGLAGALFGGTEGYASNVCGEVLLTCHPPIHRFYADKDDNINELYNKIFSITDIEKSTEKIDWIKTYEYDLLDKVGYEYCLKKGEHLVTMAEKIQKLADSIVGFYYGADPTNIKAGEVDKAQIAYKDSLNEEVDKLRPIIRATLTNIFSSDKLGNIRKEVEERGFIMLGFHYYSVTGLLEKLNEYLTIKVSTLPPSYESIEPNADEANGLNNLVAMSQKYLHLRESETLTDSDKTQKYRSENLLKERIVSTVYESEQGLAFLDEGKPVESIIRTGTYLLNTGTMIGVTFALTDIAISGATGNIAMSFTGIKSFFKALLKWLTVPMMAIAGALITCGIALVFLIPAIPLVTWMFAIFGWIIIVIETLLALPFWAIAASSSSGDGFIADTGRAGITLLLNVVIRPILLPILFFFAISLSGVFTFLIIIGVKAFQGGHTAAIKSATDVPLGPMIFNVFWKYFLVTYLLVMSFKLSHEIMAKAYDYIMRWVDGIGRGDYGHDVRDAEIEKMGLAAGGVAATMIMSYINDQRQRQPNNKDDGSGKGEGDEQSKNPPKTESGMK